MARAQQAKSAACKEHNGLPRTWREVEFNTNVNYGVAGESDELLLSLLSRLLAGAGATGPAGMTLIGTPNSYQRAGGIAGGFESFLHEKRRSAAAAQVQVVTIASPPTVRSFLSHLLMRLIAPQPAGDVALTDYAVERLRQLRIGMLLVEGVDYLLRCQPAELSAMLDLFARVAGALGIPLIGAGAAPYDYFTAAEVPFTELERALTKPEASTVFACLIKK
jgi:hypothetical protein